METKIRNYVEELFKDAPKSRQALELKDELMQNLIDKYRDLVAGGQDEETACNAAIESIGDVNELLRGLNSTGMSADEDKQRKAHAIRLSIAVMLYILSVIPLIVLSVYNQWLAGLILMFVFVAAATGLIIYNSMTKPRYARSGDNVVEDFKEWNSEKDSSRATRRAISTAVWSITVVVYFLVSFSTGAWHITWVLFLVAVAVDNIISALYAIKKEK